MSHLSAQQVIKLLNLAPLPEEGGYFRQTYQAPERIPPAGLPRRYKKELAFSTAIYALFTPTDFSAMHRLDTDEIFHFYLGDPLEMLLLRPDGAGELFTLGSNLAAGQRPQKLVERNVWQGSHLTPGGQYGFALTGTTMAPGFEWAGFELGKADVLCARYPEFAGQIEAYVR